MKDVDPDLFEASLERLRPAPPPEDFLARLVSALPVESPPPAAGAGERPPAFNWWALLRWLVPATAAAIILGAWLLRPWRADSGGQLVKPTAAGSDQPEVRAGAVEVDRELLSAFDAVARLPGGEPVRFRCREWMEDVVVRDRAGAVLVEQRAPRLEIVPIRFETY